MRWAQTRALMLHNLLASIVPFPHLLSLSFSAVTIGSSLPSFGCLQVSSAHFVFDQREAVPSSSTQLSQKGHPLYSFRGYVFPREGAGSGRVRSSLSLYIFWICLSSLSASAVKSKSNPPRRYMLPKNNFFSLNFSATQPHPEFNQVSLLSWMVDMCVPLNSSGGQDSSICSWSSLPLVRQLFKGLWTLCDR